MANNLSLISNDKIIVQERSIQVTDEKLNRLLLTTYEKARKDANTFKLYNHYGVFISIAGSLIIPLLTSTFHDFGKISGKTLTGITWGLFAASLIFGIILALIRASKQGSDEHDERDKTVGEIIEKIVSEEGN